MTPLIPIEEPAPLPTHIGGKYIDQIVTYVCIDGTVHVLRGLPYCPVCSSIMSADSTLWYCGACKIAYDSESLIRATIRKEGSPGVIRLDFIALIMILFLSVPIIYFLIVEPFLLR